MIPTFDVNSLEYSCQLSDANMEVGDAIFVATTFAAGTHEAKLIAISNTLTIVLVLTGLFLWFASHSLTVGVTRWWAGRDNAILTESTPSHENGLKTRRLPPVGARCVGRFGKLRDSSFARYTAAGRQKSKMSVCFWSNSSCIFLQPFATANSRSD